MRLKERISEIIRREDEDFKKPVKISDKYSLNTYELIKRINLYVNDQFYKRDADQENLIFWNISTPRIIHFAKNIDLDTKDLMAIGRGETNFRQAWIARMRFERWMKDNKLSLTLNDLSEGVSTYGTIIWQLVYDNPSREMTLVEADLRNLRFNPRARTIRKSPVVHFHYMDETEIREKEGIWDNIDGILKNAKKANGDDLETEQNKYLQREVWERHGEVIDENNKVHYMHYIGAGYGEKEVIAFEEEMEPEDSPYYDFHIGRYRGRLIRVGVVERLFQLQERANAVVNQNAEASQIASLLLMRTNDPNTTGNVLEGARSGQIVNSTDLQQIGITNTAFNALLGELDRIERQADKLCLTPEVITGDKMPSNIPFRSLATLANSAKSAFQYIKQTVGEEVGFLIEEKILPSVVKNWNRGGIIDIAENLKDIQIYDDSLVIAKQIEYLEKANELGRAVPEEELIALEDEYRANIEKVGRSIEIKKGFFNFKFGISLNVTGESVDKAQKNDAYFNVIQWKTANPEIVNDPYFRQYCEDNGITPIRMSTKEIQKQVAGLQKGVPTQSAGAQPEDKLSAMVNQ